MMKKINKYSSLALLAVSATCFTTTGCSDDFLREKKVYGSYGTSTVYESYEAAKSRVDYLYQCLLPSATGGSSNTDITSAGGSDDFSKCTEEYGGYSIYNDPANILTYNNDKFIDFFYVKNDVDSPYGRIRECNDVIEGVTNSQTLTVQQKNELLGQALFFRAWRYYLLVKIYGGVPIVDHVQNPIIGDGKGENLIIPRSSTKDCIKFICDDLEQAKNLLPARWESDANDFGRVTAGTALALEGRAKLLYASPLFNRADDQQRWEDAYLTNLEAINKLKEGNFGLVYEANGGEKNAMNWAKMFATYTGGESDNQNALSEAVFVTLYNNVSPIDHEQVEKYNSWEQGIRPANVLGTGGKQPTAEIVDLFPMADGKKPGLSEYGYNKELFFMNRDPRFYRTFAFPGVEWKFNSGSVNFTEDLKDVCPVDKYTSGNNYQLWNYCWYDNAEDINDNSKSGYAADKLGSKNAGIYVRKRSDDYSFGTNLYKFNAVASGNTKGFGQSASPWMEIRYTEVLLNYAEAACGAGHYPEAYQALKDIRKRVGYTEDKNYGLDASIANDRAKLFEAILYERQIELAFEGKRFDDMRRWMLFDGGVGQEALKPSWKLTGFGGNTCTYLGVEPMNGKRRHRIEIYVKDSIAEKKDDKDPLQDISRPKALTLTEKIQEESDGSIQNSTVQGLVDFYRTYFKRKDISTDGNNDEIYPTFRPEYYFLGFKINAQQTNATLLQTVGWTDFTHGGGNGTFDPLAE